MPQEKKCTAKRKRITLVMFSAGMESAGMDPTVMDSSDLIQHRADNPVTPWRSRALRVIALRA